jgi:hypothetical protein
MTDKPKLRLVLDREKELGDLARWSNTLEKDDRNKFRKPAGEALDEYILKAAQESGVEGVESIDDLTSDERKNALNFGNQSASRESAKILYEGRNEIVEDIPDGSLERMLAGGGQKIFLERASGKDEATLKAFMNYQGLEELSNRYNAGKDIPDDENTQKAINEARALGAVKIKKEMFKDYDEDTRALAESIIYSTMKRGYVDEKNEKEYVSEGLKEVVAQARKQVDKTGQPHGAARKVLLKLIESEDAEEFNNARGLIREYVKSEDLDKQRDYAMAA